MRAEMADATDRLSRRRDMKPTPRNRRKTDGSKTQLPEPQPLHGTLNHAIGGQASGRSGHRLGAAPADAMTGMISARSTREG
jgi:hypothetical protein